MSRPIKMTPEYLDECRSDFEKALQLVKMSDGKLNFTKTFPSGSSKAKVYFTPAAWAKMVILINEFEKEIAWHGVAHRLGEAEGETAPAGPECEYIITDILVYPQEVSSAAVEMDTEKYAAWLMENIEDERFNSIRMQGHSHVRMPPSPSCVDLNHQEEILRMLGDDDFYIFMIWNKMLASDVKVYDLKENTLFENGDVTVLILDEVGSMNEFLADAKAKVKNKPCTYQSYQPQQAAGTSAAKASTTVASGSYNPLAPTTNQPAPTTWSKVTPIVPPAANGEKPRTRIGAGWYGKDAWPDDDDDDNPYNPYNWSAK